MGAPRDADRGGAQGPRPGAHGEASDLGVAPQGLRRPEVRRGQGPGQDCYRGGRLRHLRRDTNFGAHSSTCQALLADLARWTPGAQALHIPGKTKRYRIFCILEIPPKKKKKRVFFYLKNPQKKKKKKKKKK